MPAKKRTASKLPVNYEEQLAKEASEISKRIAAPSGDRIRFNANRSFITPDGMEGEELEVVIVDFLSSNLFYDGPYDKDNPEPPVCFAIGPEPTLLVPSPNSPNKQSESCAVCPNNQFGSAQNGKGKACKNTRLLAVSPLEVEGDEERPIWIMSVSPTSIKAFDGYVHGLSARHKTVPIGVLTRITLDPNSTWAAPRFNVVRPLKPAELGEFMTRREEARQRLSAEPDTSQLEDPKPKKPATRRRR